MKRFISLIAVLVMVVSFGIYVIANNRFVSNVPEISDIPTEDRSFQLTEYDGEVKITAEEAEEVARAFWSGLKDVDVLSVEKLSWTYGTKVFSEESFEKNPQLKKIGYPKDLPVYVVEFEKSAVSLSQEDNNRQYVIVDADSGVVLLSYSAKSRDDI
jgi:hypothetical protein